MRKISTAYELSGFMLPVEYLCPNFPHLGYFVLAAEKDIEHAGFRAANKPTFPFGYWRFSYSTTVCLSAYHMAAASEPPIRLDWEKWSDYAYIPQYAEDTTPPHLDSIVKYNLQTYTPSNWGSVLLLPVSYYGKLTGYLLGEAELMEEVFDSWYLETHRKRL